MKKSIQPAANLAELISRVLPPNESWSDSLRICGDQRGNDIQLDYEGDSVEFVMARIYTREDASHICTKIVELARAPDCLLFFPAARAVIAAELAVLSEEVQNSRASCFSTGLREFVEKLS